MSFILNIDTAISTASVCLARDGIAIQFAENKIQKGHTSWLHIAIRELMKKESLNFSDLNAIAVSIGPGSYTGLRIGLSAAKGLCYALKSPLITVGTLEMMAYAAREEPVDLLCPMIDARRNEVFTAVYDKEFHVVLEPQAMILQEDNFDQLLSKNKILFFGNGSNKLQTMIQNKLWQEKMIFKEIDINVSCMISLSNSKFNNNILANLSYTEPGYLKDFHLP